MSKAELVTAKIRGLINAANQMTGDTDTNLTDAVGKLLTGYGSGGSGVTAGITTYRAPDGVDITAGDFVELVSHWGGGTIYGREATSLAAVALSHSRVLALYAPASGTVDVYAALVSVDGPEASVSQPYKVGSRESISDAIAAVALDDSRVLVVYYRNESGLYGDGKTGGVAVVLTVGADGSMLRAGELALTTAGASGYHEIHEPTATVLSANKVLVSYRDKDNTGKAVVLTVDGATISAGNITYYDSNVRNPKAVTLSPAKALIFYETYDWGADTALYGQALAVTISGTSITRGGPHTFRTAPSTYMAAVALNEFRAFLVFQNTSSSGQLVGLIINVNERTTTSLGSYVLGNYGSHPAVAVVGQNKVLVVADFANGATHQAQAMVVDVGEIQITKQTPLTFASSSGEEAVSHCALVASPGSNAMLVACFGAVVSYRGLTVDGATVTAAAADAPGYTTVHPITRETQHYVGVAKTGGTDGAPVYVHRAGKAPDVAGIHKTFTLYDGEVTVTEVED